jgi:hypothetical protein
MLNQRFPPPARFDAIPTQRWKALQSAMERNGWDRHLFLCFHLPTGDFMTDLMDRVSRFAFASASLALMAMSLALVVYAAGDVIVAARSSWPATANALLAAIGYVVISVAVFDVAKYFIEEEVIRGREMRQPGEARRSLTKFISTISIAVFIEGLVTVFRTSKDDVERMLYPTALLLTAILIVVGLGVFQRLSAQVEREVGAKDKKRAAS